jgi:hypothetical protein
MTELDPTAPGHPGGPGARAPERGPDADVGRVGPLRGATVEFNARRVLQVVLAIVVCTLAILVVVLTVAGLHSNDQINRLRTQGQPVTVTVSGCLGLLGGSGSNAAGDSCHGFYELGGRVYHEPLPGSTFYRPGTRIPALAVAGDPALVSPLAVIDTQHASGGVFILPAVLGAALVLIVVATVWRRRHQRAATVRASPAEAGR